MPLQCLEGHAIGSLSTATDDGISRPHPPQPGQNLLRYAAAERVWRYGLQGQPSAGVTPFGNLEYGLVPRPREWGTLSFHSEGRVQGAESRRAHRAMQDSSRL